MMYLKDRIDRHPVLYSLLALILILLVGCAVSVYQSKYWIEISHYEIESDKLSDSIRIVQLSDLHNSVFGKGNSRLIKAVAGQKPDIIILTGDMVTFYDKNVEPAVQAITALSDIAPVYFSYGNHEKMYEEKYGIDLTALFEAAGAGVLDGQYADIQVDGQNVRLGGIYGYCMPEDETPDNRINEKIFLKEFQDTDDIKLLMCHFPVAWMDYGSLDEWKIDCVFSGHAHGGQIRLPLVGGMYAPDQGFFVGWEAGLYYSRDGSRTMVLSRGLGNSTFIPRVNNRPDLTVTDIMVR